MEALTGKSHAEIAILVATSLSDLHGQEKAIAIGVAAGAPRALLEIACRLERDAQEVKSYHVGRHYAVCAVQQDKFNDRMGFTLV